MTQKELRKQARLVLATALKDNKANNSGSIPCAAAMALQVLYAPNLKGE